MANNKSRIFDDPAMKALKAKLQGSSTSLTLEQLNKAAEKIENGRKASIVICRFCMQEKFPRQICSGHGGGGGGGGGEVKEDLEESTAPNLSLPLIQTTEDFEEEEFELLSEDLFEAQRKQCRFNPNVIADLVEKGLLFIQWDPKNLSLSIRCEFEDLSLDEKKEYKKFIAAVLEEFEEFKKEHPGADIRLHLVQDQNNNITALRINLPSVVLYESFMQRLGSNLLPTPRPKAQVEDEKKDLSHTEPTPASVVLKPVANKQDIEELKPFNPRPCPTKTEPY